MRRRTWLLNTLALAAMTALGCHGQLAYNLPPSQQMMHPGPGVGGPGPGVIPVGNQMTMGAPSGPATPIGPGGGDGAMQCQYCEDGSCQLGGGACYGGGGGMPGPGATSQIAFVGEEGLQVSWDVSGAGMFDSSPLVAPGRQDFPQGAIYRLRLSNIPGRETVMLYPTLEVAPVTPRTDAYLAHAPVPVQFTEEDFDQVLSGNFVTKVIYLPDPEFQELALAGVETLVSTRLDPGCDPVAEADRRGSILAIVRIGNKDLSSTGQGAYQGNVMPAGYSDGYEMPAEGYPIEGEASYGPVEGEYVDGGLPSQGCMPGGMAANGMPVGMPTSGFSPTPVPPHMIPGGPQWGMPITGTPIGLPGPPHIPLGVPAGLRAHVMKNRTRINMPPPTPKVSVSVKQRPGMNYPAPVNKVHIDETKRAKFRLFGGTVPGAIPSAIQAAGAHMQSGSNCETCE